MRFGLRCCCGTCHRRSRELSMLRHRSRMRRQTTESQHSATPAAEERGVRPCWRVGQMEPLRQQCRSARVSLRECRRSGTGAIRVAERSSDGRTMELACGCAACEQQAGVGGEEPAASQPPRRGEAEQQRALALVIAKMVVRWHRRP